MNTLTNENVNESGDQVPAEKLPPREYRLVVTPDIAREFLDRNTNNRRPKPAQIDKISRALLLGEWQYNGEAVKFDWYGVLLDGQNRLIAIINTGVPAEMLVVEGLPPETQKTMDFGVPRTLKDILVWKGEKDTNVLAAVLNLTYVWNSNQVRHASASRPTIGQAENLLDEHPEIRDAAKRGSMISRKLPISTTLAAACWYRFDKIDSEDNEDFWHAAMTGYHLPTDEQLAEAQEKGEPALGDAVRPQEGPYLLAKYLRNEKARREAPQWVKHAITIKAWNLYRDGDESKRYLSFKGGGRGSEQFPTPR